MKCISTRFGAFDIAEDTILHFPSGLLGFPDSRRYVMLDHDTEAPFKWLQSVDEPAVAFVIIDPALFHAEYRVAHPAEALAEIRAEQGEPVSVAVILTIPSDDPGRITANLRGPLLMNPRTKFCKQVVLTDEFPTRYALFPTPVPATAPDTQAQGTAPCPA